MIFVIVVVITVYVYSILFSDPMKFLFLIIVGIFLVASNYLVVVSTVVFRSVSFIASVFTVSCFFVFFGISVSWSLDASGSVPVLLQLDEAGCTPVAFGGEYGDWS